MKISTRSEYGVRLMLELASNYGKGTLFLREISHRQSISEKYLSNIIIPLRSAGFVSSIRGAYGGYKLAKSPAEITLKDVIKLLEGEITAKKESDEQPGNVTVHATITNQIWERMQKTIDEFLDTITFKDLIEELERKKIEKSDMYFI